MQFFKLPLKKALALGVMSLALTNSAYSIPRAPCDRGEPVCCEKPAPGPFAFSFPRDVGLSCPKDFFVNLDFLAMQAKEDGLEYGITDTDTGVALGSFPVTGAVQDFSRDFRDWDWNYGFRVGLGLYFSHDFWSFQASWSHLNIEDSTSTHSDAAVVIPLWAGPTTNIYVGEANVRWKAHFNTIDLMLGKPFHLSRYFEFHPQFGLQGAWIDQNYDAVYTAKMTASNDYWGVGLRAAMQSTFILPGGWNIFGRTAGALLFSHFEVDQDYPSTAHGYTTHDEFYTNSPNWELAMGIAWGLKFNKMKNYFGLKVAYEFHQWFDQNRMRKFLGTATAGTIPNDTVSKGDFTLNGVSIRAAFEF